MMVFDLRHLPLTGFQCYFWPWAWTGIYPADLNISFIWANALSSHISICAHPIGFHFFWEPWLIIQWHYIRMMSKREKMPGPLIISLVNELTNSNSRLYFTVLVMLWKEKEKERRYMIHLKLDLLLLVTYSQKHNLTISVMETLY